MQGRWSQMMASLTSVRADDFLKAWWTSRYGRVQTPQLFAKFRDKIANKEFATDVSKDMLVTSEQYAALEIADDPIWSDFSAKARERIRSLKLLGAQQTHPVLLSALAKFVPAELERLLHLLEVVIVRYQLIGGGRTGRLEIACAKLAHSIFQGGVKTAAEARAALKEILPSDAGFKESFTSKQERNGQKARYILSHLERQERKRLGLRDELDPSISLTLEHVFPKSPETAWGEVMKADPSMSDDCTYRLGNLCLLTNVNRALGRKGFDEKKKVFVQSALKLTASIATDEKWTRAEIERRQSRLARLAAAYWRFD